jgi:hypothetical protein
VPTTGTKVLSTESYNVFDNSTWLSATTNGTQAGVLGGSGTNAVDAVIVKARNQTDNWAWTPRLTGFSSSTSTISPSLASSSTAAETTQAGGVRGDATTSATGLQVRPVYSGATSVQFIQYCLSRAPGFFDEVCYTGTGVARTVAHNLAAVPELMIVKRRSESGYRWAVYSDFIGETKFLLTNYNTFTEI